MVTKIIGLIIGIAVCAAGISCRVKEKNDPESRKIYTVIGILGAAVAIFCGILLAV